MLVLHVRDHLLREVQGPEHVDVEYLPPVVEVRALDRAESARDVGAVDQDIDAAEPLDGRIGELPAVRAARDVRRHLEHLGTETERGDVAFRTVELVGGPCGNDQLRALRRRERGQVDAEAGADPGHQHDLVLEQTAHSPNPPATGMRSPVTYAARLEARNTAA